MLFLFQQLIFFAVLVLVSAQKPNAAKTPGNCLSRFYSDNEMFRRCKNDICYVFLSESPFINLDGAMTSEKDQKLFVCKDYRTEYTDLNGIAFKLHEETAALGTTEYCVWGGPDCTFNDLVNFVGSLNDQGYQFAITGLLLETPQRQKIHEPSASIVDNSMIVIGLRSDEKSRAGHPLEQLSKPFRGGTWGVFLGMTAFFAVLAGGIAFKFNRHGKSILTIFFIFAGERGEDRVHRVRKISDVEAPVGREKDASRPDASADLTEAKPDDSENSQSVLARDSMEAEIQKEQYEEIVEEDIPSISTRYWVVISLFRLALCAFVMIFMLFYEVAVVNFLFQQNTVQIDKSVTSLTAQELREYSVLKSSALEDVWHKTVFRQGKYEPKPESFPWYRCSSAEDCFTRVLDPSHRARFIVTFDTIGKYLLQTYSSCAKLTIYKTKQDLYAFNGGWLYNHAVNRTVRQRIDRKLLDLRIGNRLRPLVSNAVGEVDCAPTQTDISAGIVGVPIAVFVAPPLALLLFILFQRQRGPEKKRTRRIALPGSTFGHFQHMKSLAGPLSDCSSASKGTITLSNYRE